MNTTTIPARNVDPTRITYTLIRALWVLVALTTLTLTILSIPAQMSLVGRITDVEGSSLGWMGVSREVLFSIEKPIDLAYMIATLVTVISCHALALLLFVRQSRERMALLTSFFLLLYGAIMAGPLEILVMVYRPELTGWIFRIEGALWLLGCVSLLLVFPDGKFVPSWTRWVAMALVPLTLPVLFARSFDPLAIDLSNPVAAFPFISWFLVPSTVAVFAVIHRYRRQATARQRLQIRWAASGFIGWMLAGSLIPGVLYFTLSTVDNGQTRVPALLLLAIALGRLVWPVGLALPPIALSIAVLRYRLYDIDLIIRRTFVFTVVSGLLGLVYVGSIVLFQGLFRSLIGQQSPLAIVTSTLLIVVLFAPLRRRVQNFIDRRFYRQKYDAQHTLDTFSETIRDEVDPDHLTAELLNAVETTLQPEHVNLWLRDPRR